MANKFEKKEWEDRQAQYPSRRKILPTNQENIYEVERAEGEVTVPGNAFDASNMNDLENRIFDSFGKLDATDIAVLDRSNVFSKNNVEDVLLELFMYASNGKKAVANAIGGSASSTFQVLANTIDSGKKSIATAIGDTKAGSLKGTETLNVIGNFIKANKASFSEEGSQFLFGETLPANNTLWERKISYNFGFVPNVILIKRVDISFITGGGFKANFGHNISDPPQKMPKGQYNIGIYKISSTGFTIWYKNGSDEPDMKLETGTIIFRGFRIPI